MLYLLYCRKVDPSMDFGGQAEAGYIQYPVALSTHTPQPAHTLVASVECGQWTRRFHLFYAFLPRFRPSAFFASECSRNEKAPHFRREYARLPSYGFTLASAAKRLCLSPQGEFRATGGSSACEAIQETQPDSRRKCRCLSQFRETALLKILLPNQSIHGMITAISL